MRYLRSVGRREVVSGSGHLCPSRYKRIFLAESDVLSRDSSGVFRFVDLEAELYKQMDSFGCLRYMVDIFGWSLNGELDILRVKPKLRTYLLP